MLFGQIVRFWEELSQSLVFKTLEVSMILFTSGFPASGKTTFVKKLIEELENKHVLHIDPKKYYLEEYEELDKDEKTAVAVEAWEMALEQTTKSINAAPNAALIILDTCCSKALHMRPLLNNSKLKGHDTLMVFMSTAQKARFLRSNDKNIKNYEESYRINFLSTLPVLKKLADHFVIINNSGDESEICKHAKNLSDKIKSIRTANKAQTCG